MLSLKFTLQKAISEAVKKIAGLEIKSEEIVLEHPENEGFGDYTTNIALVASKSAKVEKCKGPRDFAELIIREIGKNKPDFIEKMEVAGPGFINFWLKKEYLVKEAEKLLDLEKNRSNVLANKKIMIEFAHPNTHKEFHIGHLRNIATGETIVRILEFAGAKIIRANYQGDVGMHIAKCLYGIIRAKVQKCKSAKVSLEEKVAFLGKAYAEGNKAYETDPKAKKEIEEINKKIYAKDPEVYSLYEETRKWSLDYFETIYKRVYSHFDRYYFESEVAELGKKLVLEAKKKGVFIESEGAIIFEGQKHGLHNRVFITKDGNPTYEAKDMGLGQSQFGEYNPDLIIHVLGPEQKGYLQVIIKALEQLFPKTKGREFHLVYGWVRLKEGKMSSRAGNVILGRWLLDEVKKEVKKMITTDVSAKEKEEISEAVAVGAVKYSFLKNGLETEIAFDIKESINLEGNSGPYLQYTYARCASVLRKAKKPTYNLQLTTYNFNREEVDILRTIYRFFEAAESAAVNYSPNVLVSFLYDLARKYNNFYNKWPILKAEKEERELRLFLTQITANVLKKGLELLGIKTLEKM